MPGELFNRIDAYLRSVRDRVIVLANFIDKELGSPVRMPAAHAVRYWSRGFTSDTYYICRLYENDHSLYLPDYRRFKTRDINGDFSVILNNKVIFERVIGRHFRCPETIAFVDKGKILPFHSRVSIRDADSVYGHVSSGRPLVLKPVRSGGGKKVIALKCRDGVVYMNGSPVSREGLRDIMAGLKNFVLTEYVEQGKYSARIFPEVVNTVRVLTVIDDAGEPFIAFAIHKFGTRASLPVDNWRRGGLISLVELETGTLSPALAFQNGRHVRFYEEHPDTGARIEGVRIPSWEERKREILDTVGKNPFLRYVGWDLVMGDDGVIALEGNSYPDVNLYQAHRPLLENRRIRDFYVSQGIIRG